MNDNVPAFTEECRSNPLMIAPGETDKQFIERVKKHFNILPNANSLKEHDNE